jgi:hypothetical protein
MESTEESDGASINNTDWATDWSSQELTAPEKNDFENVIADLYDWIAQSDDSCEAGAKHQVENPPRTVTPGEVLM